MSNAHSRLGKIVVGKVNKIDVGIHLEFDCPFCNTITILYYNKSFKTCDHFKGFWGIHLGEIVFQDSV